MHVSNVACYRDYQKQIGIHTHRDGIVSVRAIVVEEVDQADMVEGDGNRRSERQSHLIPENGAQLLQSLKTDLNEISLFLLAISRKTRNISLIQAVFDVLFLNGR